MIEVRVSDNFMIDGVAIHVSMKHEGDARRILRLHGDGAQEWEAVEPMTAVEPTLRLQNDAARALLDALLRHYQGASDMHTVRSDLLHERDRVDKLTSGIMQIAIQASGSGWPGTSPPERHS